MKRLLLFLLLALPFSFASADDFAIALLQPLTVKGSAACNAMEISMVRGELRKALIWQSGSQVVTRLDVDAMLKEQGFQQSGMVNDAQRKKVGDMTGAQYICVSTITKYGTQLYIEAYLVDVETGQMHNPATQYANVKNEDYSTLPASCNALAEEMLGELGGKAKKTSRIRNTDSNRSVEGYVNLYLPSGTLWKNENENCGLIQYDQAANYYSGDLPTKEQWEELKNYCLWTWTGNGYIVKGKNDESIFLPAEGFGASEYSIGKCGFYWSSTAEDSEYAWCLEFESNLLQVRLWERWSRISVRLVK